MGGYNMGGYSSLNSEPYTRQSTSNYSALRNDLRLEGR